MSPLLGLDCFLAKEDVSTVGQTEMIDLRPKLHLRPDVTDYLFKSHYYSVIAVAATASSVKSNFAATTASCPWFVLICLIKLLYD